MPRVANCDLPDRIIGFVEGEHINVLLRALRSGRLGPIGGMAAGCVRDRGKPGSSYVYFRVMLSGEEANTMAFGSVGSALVEYKTRMVFRPSIWTGKQGGYVCDRDGMGQINNTPFSQAAQRAAFNTILRMEGVARGNAEVGIYGSVSMTDLESAWCIFPFSKSRIERHLARHSQPTGAISRNAALQEAAEKYQELKQHLPRAVDEGAVSSGANNHWIKFLP